MDAKSPLDLWFRRQGVNKSALDFESSSKLRLPRIREINEAPLTRVTTNEIISRNKSPSKIFSSNSNPNFTSSTIKSSIDRCRTPHMFYQRCIDDVSTVNHPDDLDLQLPRELIYVRSLPFLRYVTYGSGKCFNSMWQLEMKAQA